MTESLSDYELKILSNIEDHGCHITYVFDPEGDDPAFSYSTGFTQTVDQGEVIVFGLRSELTHGMINETLRQCLDQRLTLSHGCKIDGLLGGGFPVFAFAVSQRNIVRDHLNSAMWFHNHHFEEGLSRVFQLVWPCSRTGLFPWEDNCPDDVVSLQPILYETRFN